MATLKRDILRKEFMFGTTPEDENDVMRKAGESGEVWLFDAVSFGVRFNDEMHEEGGFLYNRDAFDLWIKDQNNPENNPKEPNILSAEGAQQMADDIRLFAEEIPKLTNYGRDNLTSLIGERILLGGRAERYAQAFEMYSVLTRNIESPQVSGDSMSASSARYMAELWEKRAKELETANPHVRARILGDTGAELLANGRHVGYAAILRRYADLVEEKPDLFLVSRNLLEEVLDYIESHISITPYTQEIKEMTGKSPNPDEELYDRLRDETGHTWK